MVEFLYIQRLCLSYNPLSVRMQEHYPFSSMIFIAKSGDKFDPKSSLFVWAVSVSKMAWRMMAKTYLIAALKQTPSCGVVVY